MNETVVRLHDTAVKGVRNIFPKSILLGMIVIDSLYNHAKLIRSVTKSVVTFSIKGGTFQISNIDKENTYISVNESVAVADKAINNAINIFGCWFLAESWTHGELWITSVDL